MLTYRLGHAAVLAALIILARGELAFASAGVISGPIFDDPTTLDVTDVCGLIAKSFFYSDPMAEVRQSLLVVVLRPIGEVPVVATPVVDDYSPRANRPRAPPGT